MNATIGTSDREQAARDQLDRMSNAELRKLLRMAKARLDALKAGKTPKAKGGEKPPPRKRRR